MRREAFILRCPSVGFPSRVLYLGPESRLSLEAFCHVVLVAFSGNTGLYVREQNGGASSPPVLGPRRAPASSMGRSFFFFWRKTRPFGRAVRPPPQNHRSGSQNGEDASFPRRSHRKNVSFPFGVEGSLGLPSEEEVDLSFFPSAQKNLPFLSGPPPSSRIPRLFLFPPFQAKNVPPEDWAFSPFRLTFRFCGPLQSSLYFEKVQERFSPSS